MSKKIYVSILAVILAFVTGTSAAFAAEVPAGAKEVKIPLVLAASSAAAGAEIGFTQSSGLKYLRFEPAAGAQNPVKTTASGKTWVGFFGATNKYKPSGGSIAFGSLVFEYTGKAAEKVTIAETRLHRLTGEGSNVDSTRSYPKTVIPVTRATSSGNTGESNNNGNSDPGTGSGSGSNPGSGSGSVNGSTSGSGSDVDNGSGSSSGASAGAVLIPNTPSASGSNATTSNAPSSTSSSGSATQSTPSGSSSASNSGMVPFTPSADSHSSDISDENAPLADSAENVLANSKADVKTTAWLLLLAALALIALGIVIFLIVKRRRNEA